MRSECINQAACLTSKDRPHTSKSAAMRLEDPGPPLSQRPHGSLLSPALAVRDPFCFSKAQKNSVLLGWSGLSTGMFPAKLRATGKVTLGNCSVTSKSVGVMSMHVQREMFGGRYSDYTHISAIRDLKHLKVYRDSREETNSVALVGSAQ